MKDMDTGVAGERIERLRTFGYPDSGEMEIRTGGDGRELGHPTTAAEETESRFGAFVNAVARIA